MTFADLFLKANPLLVAWVDFLFTLSVEVKKQGRVLAFNDRSFKTLRPFFPKIEKLIQRICIGRSYPLGRQRIQNSRVKSMATVRAVISPYFKKVLRDAFGFFLCSQ
jgi:hypothetical protein